jgi:hypothetical protein
MHGSKSVVAQAVSIVARAAARLLERRPAAAGGHAHGGQEDGMGRDLTHRGGSRTATAAARD